MPTLVLLPGLEGSGEFFSPLINALGASVKTQVLSYPQEQALNYSQLTELVEKSLPENSPYIVLGESFSGPIAVNIAATQPPNLKALILVGTFVLSPVSIPKMLRGLACSFPASWLPFNLITRFLLANHKKPDILSRLKEILSGIPDTVFRERLLSILNVDVCQALVNINVPILYIRATQDKIVPKTASELIVSLQPNTKIIEIDGPHFILQTQPEQSAIQIHKFLKNLKSPE
jgi:pimeloyl-ACP methyl ester carboxylesterase